MATPQEGSTPLRILIHGVSGRMGREVLAAVGREKDLETVGGVRNQVSLGPISLPNGGGNLPLFDQVETALQACNPQVIVDFTNANAALSAARTAISRGIHVVIGTTGLAGSDLQSLDLLAQERGVGGVVAPNFALGAVLLMHLSRIAGRYFDHAEIVEAHHEAKIDAPSGTALAIAQALVAGQGKGFINPIPEKEPLPGTRGGDQEGIAIQAMRMPGRLAHHEVILGTAGQTLSLRHDTISRECYMPGVLVAIRAVAGYKGLVVGLEKVLGL